MKLPPQAWTVGAVALAGVALYVLIRKGLSALNPFSSDNVIYSNLSVNGDTLGGATYDLTHGNPTDVAPSFNADSLARHQRLVNEGLAAPIAGIDY